MYFFTVSREAQKHRQHDSIARSEKCAFIKSQRKILPQYILGDKCWIESFVSIFYFTKFGQTVSPSPYLYMSRNAICRGNQIG